MTPLAEEMACLFHTVELFVSHLFVVTRVAFADLHGAVDSVMTLHAGDKALVHSMREFGRFGGPQGLQGYVCRSDIHFLAKTG